MKWEPMTVDEYAAFQQASGAKVLKVKDTWWTEARPFFFRPLFPFAELPPQYKRYPLQAVIGGVLHLVPVDVRGNSHMNLFIYDQLGDYSLQQMGAKQRWIIKKGISNFEARRITDFQQFVEEAAPIYRAFYARTRYFYKSERREREAFAAWAAPLFRFPKVVVTGAYSEGRLHAIDVSYRVEDVIIDDVFFSDSESQPLKVTDFLVHTLREEAKGTDARLLFRGFPSGKQTLDESKLSRGCKVWKLPAFCRINPLALYIGRSFMNQSYRKLLAITSFSELTEKKGQFAVAG